MRTSEIIMPNFSVRSISNARSPESASTVSKPWLRKKESSRLRWPASSSTIRMRGAGRLFLRTSGGTPATLAVSGRQFQVSDAEDGAGWVVGPALNFPAVRQDCLLHDGQTQSGPFLVRREVRLENLAPALGRNARAVVAHFQ